MMNIVLATDNNFVQHCCVAMTSVLKNNRDVKFYIFSEGLSQSNEEILFNHVDSFGGCLEICKVDSRIVGQFPMPSNADAHISIATYYRLFSALILPTNIDKVIYMDCDMIVRNSLDDLWKIDLEDYALGAVFQASSDAQNRDKRRLLIPVDKGYFNAGLLLLNLKYWREKNVTERLLEFIKNHYLLIKQHDQDVLNAVLYNEVLPISYTWNFLPLFFNVENCTFCDYVDYNDLVTNPAIIHFVSAPKPWDYGCNNPYKSEYYKYIEMTPFKGFKPKFIWKKYLHNVIRHKLFHIIISIDIFKLRNKLKKSILL